MSAFDELFHVLLLRDYNTRLVVISTMILGAAAGMIGSFLLLRKRSLMGDALSHATLPGIAVAFIVMVAFGGTGKALVGLLAGALVFGLIGVGSVILIRTFTRLKDDAAMGIVLSVFFGIGIALLGVIQRMPQGSAAGLESFIYGKTASMVHSDFLLISGTAICISIACLLLYKELALLCFDDAFAGAQGWPTGVLDLVMLTLVAGITVVGLQSVGLILIIALLIIPPAAARFWTERLLYMILASALIGAVSGWVGSSVSALVHDLPAGAIIVLVAAAAFVVSMICGGRRGVLVRATEHFRLKRKVGMQHLLRAFYERLESAGIDRDRNMVGVPVSLDDLLAARAWSRRELRRLLRRAQRAGFIDGSGGNEYGLTVNGLDEAMRTVRNHRLWEMYLITHADIAPSHVDRDADMIEHVLEPDVIRRLEQLLAGRAPQMHIPPSPHALE